MKLEGFVWPAGPTAPEPPLYHYYCNQNGMRIRLNNTMCVFFSVLVDVKTGWKVGNWPLIQPRTVNRGMVTTAEFLCAL